MAKPNNFHKAPCANCGHADMHGEVAGCIAVKSINPDVWCDCETYVAPAPVARTIPSRRTDPSTSHEAAASVVVTGENQRGLLLKAFQGRYGDDPDDPGLTDEEAMNRAVGVTAWSEYAKRCSELRDAGLIEATGETRKGESGRARIVSRITDAGLALRASLR